MPSIIANVTMDCARPWELAQFWAQVFGRPVHPDNEPDDDEVGVVLDDDPRPVRAAACEATAAQALRLTLTEGKYHQVKRMLAAVGNRVTALHRSRIGRLQLSPQLAPGQWAWLAPEHLAAVTDRGQ